MDVAKIKGKFPQEWNESLGMSSEEFQTLHQFIGSKWGTEYNEKEFIREVSAFVPRPKTLSVFFGVTESLVTRFLDGIPTKEVREIKVPLERIIEIEDRLEKMTKMFEETLRQVTALEKTKDVESLDARKVLGIDVIEDRLDYLSKNFHKTLLQVATKGIKPTHEQALANHYAKCDLQDMVILLEEADKQDDDTFYEHWDKLLKDSSTGELINALADVLQSDAKHAVTRFDEVFDALKGRAPFEQMYHHIEDMKKDIASNERLITGGLKDADEDTDSKYAFIEKKLDRLAKFIKSKYPNDAEVLDELMTK